MTCQHFEITHEGDAKRFEKDLLYHATEARSKAECREKALRRILWASMALNALTVPPLAYWVLVTFIH